MKRGYLPLYRKIQDHEFYKEKRVFSKYEAWLDILMEAQHSEDPKDVILGMTVLVCNYGESLKSIKTWSKRWKWTESKVRRYFILLEKLNQIRTKSEVITTRLSVINYSAYDPRRRASEEQATSKRRGADEQATTDKNVKNENNDKNVKNYSDEIKNFTNNYQQYVLNSFPKTAPKITTSLIQGCCDTIDKLIRLDNFTFKEIYDSIQWASNDDFWSDQILSLSQLRKKAQNGNKKFVNMFTAYKKGIVPTLNVAEKRLKSNLEVSRRFLNDE